MNPGISLTTLDGGRIYTRAVRFLGPDGAEELRDMADPNHCYLIRHPRGLLLWDTGLSDAIAALPGHSLTRGRFRFVVETPLAGQLARLGLRPEDVDLLAFSHLQVDHAGNCGLFRNAQVLVQQAEWERAFEAGAEAHGYILADYETLHQRSVTRLAGDRDVFGDGKVVILSAPGHTPGHQVLFVDLPAGGPVLLSGDLYYTARDPELGWLPAWNHDLVQTRRTSERLRRLAAETGARWIINHDPDTKGAGGDGN